MNSGAGEEHSPKNLPLLLAGEAGRGRARQGEAGRGRAGQGEAGQGPTTVFAAIGPTDGLCVERPWLGSQSGS